MMIEEARICQSLRKIVGRLTTDPALQEDLMQESLIRLWRLEIEKPGRTRSWYLQNCRFHLQHCLASGRSLDSLKRAKAENRITIDGINDELLLNWYHTNGELLEIVSARDILSALAGHLKPRESVVLDGLADGLVLHDVAVKFKLSYPTVLKYRRRIAELTIKLGISPPLPYLRRNARRSRQPNAVTLRHAGPQINGVKHRNPVPGIPREKRPVDWNGNGRARDKGFKPVVTLPKVKPRRTRSMGDTPLVVQV